MASRADPGHPEVAVPRLRVLRELGLLLGIAVAYMVAAKLGLRLGIVHPSASPVWAPTGLALAAFLMLGSRVWPAIFVGAFLVNVTTAGTVATSLGIATGNTLEGLLGALAVGQWASGPLAFDRGRDVVRFAALAGLAATTISATIGVTSLALAGYAPWGQYGVIWLTWWLGDAAGALLVAPPLLLWLAEPRVAWPRGRLVEAAALLATLVATSLLAFTRILPLPPGMHTLDFLCIPALIWAALRFGPREAATALALVSAIAVWATVGEFDLLDRSRRNEALVLLQTFMAVTAVTVLLLAAVVAERRHAEEEQRLLAVTDPLTGIANYRQLMIVLEAELKRSDRTGRPVALLLLDLDGLKRLNDRYGHLVGSRALVRMAQAVRLSCRAIDTAARYGGDEFAVVLPELDDAPPEQVARRIRQRLTADPEHPPFSASSGVAVYPKDGATIEDLIRAADQVLYAAKGERR